jgi:hypothetical protein
LMKAFLNHVSMLETYSIIFIFEHIKGKYISIIGYGTAYILAHEKPK